MKVPISGAVLGQREVEIVNEVMQDAVDRQRMDGRWVSIFERDFSSYMRHRHGILCNSGSSANLLALAALELPKGSEVITCAVNFPTTVNAIIQLGLVPVFVDADPRTLNAVWLQDAINECPNVRAAVVAHMLGNPANLGNLSTYIPVIEDCCDAVGSTINGQMVGQRGVMATVSFYPAHHMTMEEGGIVLTSSPKLRKVIESFRDWGRGCWCEPGQDGVCGTRFAGDYDHKYTYERIGWNLKATNLQAGLGLAQLERLPEFIRLRRENWNYLRAGLDGLPLEFVEAAEGSDPSWFGFAFLTPERNKLARYLDSKDIGNRPIMGGNLLRQPAYKDIECRVIGNLDGANRIHEQGLWIGCYPGITKDMLDYVIESMRAYFDG